MRRVYDSEGNLLSSGAGNNVYDFENRLVQAGGVQLVYDGDGNRVQETVAGIKTLYEVAEVNPTGYAQVIEERGNAPGGIQVIRDYVYGLELLRSRTLFNGNSAVFVTAFYGMDGHGSVRYLTSETGMVTDTYDVACPRGKPVKRASRRNAFGNLINQIGSTANNYLFAGEQFDPALGIYYNRARYYDQRQGRFWTMDPALPRVRKPSSLHRFSYVSQNPINKIDRNGLEEGDVSSTIEAVTDDQILNEQDLDSIRQLVESAGDPGEVAESPETFGFFAKAIAFLMIGTIALGSYFGATGSGGQVPTDQALAEANSNNYDIYRFGNATRTAPLRQGLDYELNGQGKIDAQSPIGNQSYRGASAFRDPYFVAQKYGIGVGSVVWRVGLQTVQIADGLSVIADGRDVDPQSSLPEGHHTIFPTVQMTADDFDQRVASLGWQRVPGRVK